MKRNNFKKSLACCLLSFLVVACSTDKSINDPGAPYKNYSSQALFSMGEKSVAKGSYAAAIKYFEALASLYPFDENSEQAQRDLILSYYKTKDYASAEAAADRYIRVYPQSSHTDFAYYIKGLSQLSQNRTFLQRLFPVDIAMRDMSTLQDAFYSFRDLLQFYPKSEYAAEAKTHLIYLRDVFAQYELEVATYYFNRGAYQASINRADNLIKIYQGTPQVKGALILLVKANRKMGLNDAAQRALEVLKRNFPQEKIALS